MWTQFCLLCGPLHFIMSAALDDGAITHHPGDARESGIRKQCFPLRTFRLILGHRMEVLTKSGWIRRPPKVPFDPWMRLSFPYGVQF